MSRKYFLLALILCLGIIITGCQEKVDPRETEIVQLVVQKKYDEAITRTKELYDGEEMEEMISWINSDKQRVEDIDAEIRKAFATPSDKLEIQSGWEWKRDGNYTYITGRVKNMTDTNITYFKLTAEYLDSAESILDTDYTNSGETIKPDAMKEFEIMHKHQEEYKKVRLIVEEVNN